MISKSLSFSEKRASLHTSAGELAEFCQMLYMLLVAHTDDFGRMAGDSFSVKHGVDPTSPRSQADFERALELLHQAKLLQRYLVDGRIYLQINDFDRHQQGLHRRTTSRFPEIPGSSGNPPEIPGELELELEQELEQELDHRGENADRDVQKQDPHISVCTRAREKQTASPQNGTPRPPMHANPNTLINGHDQRRHGTHFYCDYQRGACVHQSHHDELKKRFRKTDADLRAFYETVTAQLQTSDEVVEDIFKFWNRKATERWVPKPEKKFLTKGERQRKILADMRASMRGAK